MSATAMNDLASLDAAIADMREARQSHEDWARHLRTGGCRSVSRCNDGDPFSEYACEGVCNV